MGSFTVTQDLLLDKLRRNLEDYGWRVALRKSIGCLLWPLYAHRVFRLYRIELLDRTSREDLARGDNLFFTLLTAQDADAIAQIEAMAEWLRGSLEDRLVSGQLCLAALDGRDVVAFNLVRFDKISIPLARLEKRLTPGGAWSEDILVRKDLRRTGIASRLRLRLFHTLRQRGVGRFYAGHPPFNVASGRMQESVGLKPIVDVHYRRVVLFQTWRCKRVPR